MHPRGGGGRLDIELLPRLRPQRDGPLVGGQAEALPADDERRTFTLVYTAYLALSLTDPARAISPLVRNSNAVIDVVAAQLRTAQAAGDMPAGLDPDLEAISLLTMSAGLGTSIIGGQSSAGQAQAVIDYHLRRLFPAYPPA